MKFNKKILILLLGLVLTFALVGYKTSDSGSEDVYGEGGSGSGQGGTGSGSRSAIGLGGGGLSDPGGSGGSGGSGSGSDGSSSTELLDPDPPGAELLYNNGEDCVEGMKNAIVYIGGKNNFKHDDSSIRSNVKQALKDKGYDENVPIFNLDHKQAIRFGDTGTSNASMIYCEPSMLGKAWVVIGYTTKQKRNKDYKYNKLKYYYVGCCINNGTGTGGKVIDYSKTNGLGTNNNEFGRHLQTNLEWEKYTDTCNGDREDWVSCSKVKNQCIDFEGFTSSTSRRSGRFQRCKPADTSLYGSGGGDGGTGGGETTPCEIEYQNAPPGCMSACIKCEGGDQDGCDMLKTLNCD